MKCPWCWKKIAFAMKIARDPSEDVSPNGAPFLCQNCRQISIVIADGRSLRKPTPDEARALTTAQAAALRIPEGQLTPEEISRVARDVQRDWATRKKEH